MVLQYSMNGTTWTDIKEFSYTGASSSWEKQTVTIPWAARSASTYFRWYQKKPNSSYYWSYRYDVWAIDNIEIETSNYPYVTYKWLPSNLVSDSTGKTTKAFINKSTTFNVVVTDTISQCSDTVSKKITVRVAKPSFSYNIGAVKGDTVSFTNTSQTDGVADSFIYFWRFGDGKTSSLENPKHVYDAPGNYTVKQVIKYNNSCIDSSSSIITILSPPVPDFLASTGCVGDDIFFTNTTQRSSRVDTFIWDFGDGAMSRQVNPEHVYSQSGFYTVKLIAKRRYGWVDTFVRQINLLPGIDAGFSLSAQCAGDELIIRDTSEIDKGFIAFIDFDLNGDGNYDSTYLAPRISIPRTFNNPGRYKIGIKATSNLGCVDTASQFIDIYPKPTTSFSYQTECLGTEIDLTDRTLLTSGSITSVEYDLDGDGVYDTTLSQNSVLKYTFGHGDNLSIKQKATTDKGCEDTYVATVNTKATPRANFSTLSECVNEAVVFQDISSSGGTIINKVYFDFDEDGVNDASFNSTGNSTSNTWTSTGIREIRMIVESSNGCSDTLHKNIDVSVKPTADFSVSEACEGDKTFLIDKSSISSGSIISVDYDYDNDGTYDETGIGQGGISSYTYANSGIKTIKIRATSDKGCVTESSKFFGINKTVTVNPNPSVGFSANTACQGLATIFNDTSSISSGSITTLSYDFDGDGVMDSTGIVPGSNFSYKYDSKGTYSVNVLAQSDKGCLDLFTAAVGVKEVPVADFTVSKNCEGQITEFQDNSTISGASLTRIDYDFDNDGIFDTVGVNPGDAVNYTFTSFGSKSVVIRASSNQGCVTTASKTFEFSPKPEANFGYVNNCLGDETRFIDSSSIASGSLSSYTWSFGDGGQSSLKLPRNQYASLGSYTVKLIVNSNKGCKDTIQRSVDIVAVPQADYSYTGTCEGDSFSFKNKSKGTGFLRYNWSFGDGESESTEDPYHIFDNSGIHEVKLQVENSNGCKDSSTNRIRVYDEPVAQFNSSNICQGERLQFSNASFGASTYSWNFGDNSTAVISSPSHVFANDSVYTIQLIATSSQGCSDTIAKQVEVFTKPNANFTFSNICEEDTVTFTNSSNNASIYEWSFGNGAISTTENPSQKFRFNGSYNVSLIVTSTKYCKDTVVKSLKVYKRSVPQFNFNDACFGDTSVFTNNTTGNNSYSWRFGDGSSSSLPEPKHLYSLDSTYLVSLLSTTANGCVDSALTNVVIKSVPEASFTHQDVCDGELMRFTNKSNIRSGEKLLLSWEFGENSAYSLDQNPSYRYNNSGQYTVRLVAESSAECFDTLEKTVNVFAKPEPKFTTKSDCVDEPIGFNNQTKGSGNSWAWNFGDGKTATVKSPNHKYLYDGAYRVSLEVTNANGCVADADTSVVVYRKPIASFTATEVCYGNRTTFSNLSTGAVSYNWTFDNKGSSTTHNPYFTFNSAGYFDVDLEVTSAKGCKDTFEKTVPVWSLPIFSASATDVCYGEDVNFTSFALSGKYWEWNFGDGKLSNKKEPDHEYQQAGTYDYFLVVTDSRGCSDTVFNQVEVYELPTPEFNAANVCAYDSVEFINASLNATSYQWNYDDGAISTVGTSSHKRKFSASGNYNIQLIATSQENCVDSITKRISIYQVPEAAFSISNVCHTNFSEFINESSGDISSYSWDLGNNTQSGVLNPRIRYTTRGNYNVELVTESPEGCTDTAVSIAVVYPLPLANFQVDNACLYDSLAFVNKSTIATGNIANYK